MNRNQKIALGCGGAGCLGLIVVLVAGVAIYIMSGSSSSRTARNYNFNLNSNSSDPNSNSSSDEANTNTSSSSSSSSMSDDDRHKLFQAAGATGDSALIQRVLKKIGLMSENGVPTSGYAQFMKDHFAWALKNGDFMQSINTPEKARAYVDEHLD